MTASTATAPVTNAVPVVEPPDARDRLLATLVHGGAMLGFILPLAHLLIPAVTWGVFGARQAEWGKQPRPGHVSYVIHHAREAFRFQLLASLWGLCLLFGIESDLDGLLEVLHKAVLLPSLIAYLWLLWSAAQRARRGDAQAYPWVHAELASPAAPEPAPAS
ncbi:MAG: DUF4870 domain-containing protein [Planctomycetota bacterium]